MLVPKLARRLMEQSRKSEEGVRVRVAQVGGERESASARRVDGSGDGVRVEQLS